MPELDLEKIDLGSFGINEESQRQTQLNASMTEALKVNPDQHAKVTNLSKQSGVPEFAVKSDPEQVEQKLKLDQINLEGMVERSPATSKFLTDDVNNPVIAQEDVIDGLLEGFEETFRGIGRSIGIGFDIQGKGLQLAGTDDTATRIQDLIPPSALPLGIDPQEVSEQFAASFGIETDEQLAEAKQQATDRLLGEIQELQKERQTLTPEDLNIVQEGVRAGVESLANMAPGFGLMLLSGGRAAPLLITIGAQTFASSYGEGRADGLTPEEAQWFAGIDAAIEVGTELLPTGTLERILTGKSKGLKKEALKFVVQEMGTEQLATALQTLNSVMFGLDEELQNAQGAEEVINIQLRRQAVTAIATIVAGGTQITAATAVNKTIAKLTQTEVEKETQGDIEQRNIDKLNEDSEKSKLRKLATESFKQFIREADTTDTHVFIDAVQTTLYLQEKTPEEIEADPALKTLSNAVQESQATGADAAISIDEFTGDIAGTEHFTELREHMTLSEDTISPFREEQHREETQAYVDTIMAEAQENASEYVEAQETYTNLREQLIDSGAVNAANASVMAQVMPAWVTAKARRDGQTVNEVYESLGFVVEGPQTGELTRLEGEQVLTQLPVEQIETEFREQIESDFPAAVEQYDNNPESKNGKILNTDTARELSDVYLADRTQSAAVHEPASEFIKKRYTQKLAEEPKPGELPAVLFTAGGTGAGKSSSVDGLFVTKDYQVVFDTNMNKFESADSKIKQALNAGKDVQIVMVYREPVEALVNGALPRAMRQEANFGSGRTVPIEEHINTHIGATDTIIKLSEKYEDNESVQIQVIDNSRGKDNSRPADIEFLKTIDYTGKEAEVKEALENEFEKNTISESVYQGFKGTRAVPEVERDSQQEALRQPQPDSEEARGYYDPANSVIRLTESSNLSTFLHEFAHFMYEMEAQGNTDMNQSINNWYKRNAEAVAKEATIYLDGDFDVLKQGERDTEAPQKITEEDVVNYLDTESSGSKDKDSAIRRAVHEQFARGFETYLMEGKAPSIELRNAFRTFARWLAQIYQALRGDLKVNLDAEMRAVFDRLLATEEQIAAAESRARVEPMFTDAAMAGMTEAEFTDYEKRQEKVKDVQSETLREKLIKQLTRQTKAWWKEEKADLIDEELDRLKTEQVYSTGTRLRDGDIKLDHATVKEMIGEERTDKLGRTSIRISDKLRGLTAKGQKGVHPDEAAAFFGYNSGSEMLTDLTTAPPIKETAEGNAESRMLERHGDIFTDGTIEQQADEAVQNEERGKLILHELKILARGTNQRTLDRQTMKSISKDRIGNLSFREIHPGKYRKAEIRAAQESARMLAEGNKEGAAQAKARQVLNYYLGIAATEAKNDTVKIVDRMSRYNKKKVREEIQKAEGGYWDQIVKILERFEFRKSATLTSVDQINQDINTWSKERMEIDGDGLVLHNAVLNESFVTHWKNVAHSDLQGINDSVKNIEHVARYANKLTRMGEEIEFNKLVNRWVTSMEEKVKTRFKSKRTDVVEGKKWGRWLMAQMTKIPVLASWLDGGERAGISHQVLVQPFTDAYDAEIKLWNKAGKPVMDAILGRSKEDMKRHNRKIYIPEIDDNLYGHQIIAVALNTGNAGNLRKLLLGEQWADPDIDAEITLQNPKLQAVLSHMTESDWQLAQMIWDQMETLYPQLSEVHRRTTGLVPPKVEATPVETPFGTFKGGYYPIKYDPNRSHKAAQNEDRLNAETESMFSNNASIQTSVNTGSTNERTGFYDAIRLSLDVVPAHFQEAIHYITHHDPVREINRLTRDQRVAKTIKEKLGPEEYAQLKPWLNDIAKDGREAPTKMFWDDILQRLRFGVTLGAMGFKASTGIIQLLGLSNSIAEVGLGNMYQAMRSILGSTTTMRQAWDFAVENSKVLEHRPGTMDREIKNAMKRIASKRGIVAAAQEASMKHIALIQTFLVDLPSWHAAYIKGMDTWGDETRAFQYADWVIENVQGSGATKDMARVMRGQSETGRMFTMFMTFFSSLWNMERDLVKGARSGRYSTTNVAAKAMFMFTIPVLLEMLLRGEFAKEDDDEETITQKMLIATALYPVQSIPFVRDVANAVTSDFGYNISPLQAILEQGTRSIPEVVKRGFTDEEITKGQVKGATKFIGAALGIPGTGQAWATGEHLHQVIVEGEELTLHQFLFGPERK